jgi:integrase
LFHRGDPFTNSSRKLAAISEPGLPLLCPVKMIIIVALRLGAVAANSINDLLRQTARCRDRTVKWVDSSRPVLPAINLGGSKVVPTAAANSKQLGSILAAAALSAGVVGRVRPHDIHRGAAKDVSVGFGSVTRQGAAATLGEVQHVLGHSHESLQRGVTQGYVGVAHVDNWDPRLAAQLDDPFSNL